MDKHTASTGKGMPDKTPQAGRERPGRQDAPRDASAEASLAMPHERDQATDMTAEQPNPKVKQAGKDLARGLQETSKATEMDRAYRKLK